MLLLVEGMDNTGKTTLATRLHESLNIPVVKTAPYKNVGDRDSYIKQLIRFLECSLEADFIVDRHPIISENVYGPIIDNRNIITQHPLWSKLVQTFAKTNPAIIYCRPEDSVVKEFDNREQMKGVKENIDALLFRYDSLMRYLCSINYSVYWYDWTDAKNYNKVQNWCLQRLQDYTPVCGELLRDMTFRFMLYCYFPATIDVKCNNTSVKVSVDTLIDSGFIHANGVIF